MITSSKFFEKSFFTIQNNQEKGPVDQLSPWGLVYSKNLLPDNNRAGTQNNKINNNALNRGYEITRNSSLKYIERKLKMKSQIHRSHLLVQIQQQPKYTTIQQNLKSIQTHKSIVKHADSMQMAGKLKKYRKKYQLFPQLTINQYNDIKAKGSSLNPYNTNPIQEILERRKNRKKILEEFGKCSPVSKISGKLKQIQSKSIESKSVLSGRYVYIAKNPQFSVNGLPTTKMEDQQ